MTTTTYTKGTNAPLSEHFSSKELACHCGCGFLPTQEFINLLEKIREGFGKPLIINSGARCRTYNTKIGGARFSAHCEGIAVDIARNEEFLIWITERLDHYNLWMEDSTQTPTWHHIDTKYRPVGRIFKAK